MPAATVCVNLSCLHISSYKNIFLSRWDSQGRICYSEERGGDITVVNKAERQIGNGVTGLGYGDGVGGILHIAERSNCAYCMT